MRCAICGRKLRHMRWQMVWIHGEMRPVCRDQYMCEVRKSRRMERCREIAGRYVLAG